MTDLTLCEFPEATEDGLTQALEKEAKMMSGGRLVDHEGDHDAPVSAAGGRRGRPQPAEGN